MIILKLLFVLLIATLWRLGGWNKAKWSGYRDVLIPIFIGLFFAFYYKTWWLFPAMAASYNIIRIGYGIPDPTDEGSWLGRTFKHPWLVRGIAGILYAALGSFWLFFTVPNFLPIYLKYMFAGFLIGSQCHTMDVKLSEPTIGFGVAYLVLLT